jgi:hypothetical protein
LELLKGLHSVVSKVRVAERTATTDLELLKEILRDLEQAKDILGSASEGPSKGELPAENLPDSRSLESGRGTIEESSTEDSEARVESDVKELENQVDELGIALKQALDEEAKRDSSTGTDWCSRSEVNCHPEAECRNGASNYTCHCKTGFEGNGTHCQHSANLETATSESKESSNTSQDNNSTEELKSTEGIFTTEGLNNTEDKTSTEGVDTTEGNTTVVNNGTEENNSIQNTSEGSSTMDENITSEDNVEDASVNPSKISSNDTNSKNTEALQLEEMIFDWREKFFIIVAFFILFAVLFLIIIAVLIYKMKQSGEYTPIDAPNGSPVSG